MSLDVTVWRDLHTLAVLARRRYRLHRFRLEPMPLHSGVDHLGDCDTQGRERLIRIRVHQLRQPHVPLSLGTILDTLAHELAHLRHPQHDRAHQRFTRELLGWLRATALGEDADEG